MEKILELLFVTEEGKMAKISIENPKEPVDAIKVKEVMTQIISGNVFTTKTGSFVSTKGARLVERNVNEYDVNQA